MAKNYKPKRGVMPPEMSRLHKRKGPPNETVELARRAVAAWDAGRPVPLLIVATFDNQETKSFVGMSPNDASATGTRVQHWAAHLPSQTPVPA